MNEPKNEIVENKEPEPIIEHISQPFIVDSYYVDQINSSNNSKFKKYIRRKRINGHFFIPKTPITFLNWLKTKLSTIPINKKDNSSHIGYINDNIYFLHNPVKVPPPPKDWDILFFNGNVSKYEYSHENNNVYWCKGTITQSDNFVININKLFDIISKISINKDFNLEWITKNTNSFIITQYYFVDNIQTSVYKDLTKHNDYTTKNNKNSDYEKRTHSLLDKYMKTEIDVLKKIEKTEIKNHSTKISFITVIEDPNTFYHTILQYNLINYPNSEMIIIDYKNLEMKIKRLLKTNSERFKLVKVNNVDLKNKYSDTFGEHIPLGFLLNSSIQLCLGNIVIPLLDGYTYNIESLQDMINNFILSNKECFIGLNNSGFNLNKSSVSLKEKQHFSISNFIFTINFWKMNSFDELCSDTKTLIYKFIKDRKSLVRFYESSLWNFKFNFDKKSIEETEKIQFPFSVHKLLKESYIVMYDKFSKK